MADARANQLVSAVSANLDAAIQSLHLTAGSPELEVQGDFPIQIVTLNARRPATGERRHRNLSPIRWEGNALRVDDTADGAVTATVGLVGGGSQFLYTVDGEEFEDGTVRVPGLRFTGGGLLVWEYGLVLSVLTGPARVQVLFQPAVTLRSVETLPASVFPTAVVGAYDQANDLSAGTTVGTLYQLCGHYGPDGRITIYKQRPGVAQDVPGSSGYNNGFFNVTG